MAVTDHVIVATVPDTDAPARRDLVARALAVAALAVTAWVHAPLVPEHWGEVPYLGVAFAVLVIASAAIAGSLLVESSRTAWWLALVLTAGALVLYAVSRSIGLPGAADEVGDWTSTAGVVAGAAELVVVLSAAIVLWRRRSTS